MSLFDGRAGATVVIGLLSIVAVAVAVEGYVERSSDAALANFISSANSSASDPDQSGTRGKTGCPVGNKELPTRLMPLP